MTLRKCLAGFSTICCILLFNNGKTQQPAVVDDREHLVNLAPVSTFLEDTSTRLKIDAVLQLDKEGKFQTIDKPVINFGVSASAFWLKLRPFPMYVTICRSVVTLGPHQARN